MQTKFQSQPTRLADARLLIPTLWPDARGYFAETYNGKAFEALDLIGNFVQCNQSVSHRNVLRGLHFQRPPHALTKLVQCLSGEILDVIVDLRTQSPTFGQWQSFTLSGENHHLLYVPQGFAHGFWVVSDQAHVLYMQDDYYAPMAEDGICWNDPDLAIEWPAQAPILSEKDQQLPFFSAYNRCF